MADVVFSYLLLISITIILGYIGSVVFSRTKIPDVIWLLLLGLLVGPVFHLVDTGLFTAIAPVLGAIALAILLYGAGLNMDFYQMIRGAPRATLLAVVNIALATAAVASVSMLFFGFTVMQGMLLGVIVGGTSSPIVIAISNMLNIRGRTRIFLDLESIITDPLTIVLAITLIGIIASGLPASTAVSSIFSAFSIGAVLGVMSGVIWLFVLDVLKGRPFDYMITLATVFLVYVLVESIGGSGAISALFFGLVLGNSGAFSRMLKLQKMFTVDKVLKLFHDEVSFFIRSFFFVFIGVIVTIDYSLVLYGVVIAVMLMGLRFIGVRLATLGMELTRLETNIASIMAPRGLAAAVLAGLPIAFNMQGGEIYLNVAFVVILATVIYTSLAVRFFYRPTATVEKKIEKAEQKKIRKVKRTLVRAANKKIRAKQKEQKKILKRAAKQ